MNNHQVSGSLLCIAKEIDWGYRRKYIAIVDADVHLNGVPMWMRLPGVCTSYAGISNEFWFVIGLDALKTYKTKGDQYGKKS
jgi:hypothetical protein